MLDDWGVGDIHRKRGTGFPVNLAFEADAMGKVRAAKDQKSYVLPHMWTLDQGQTQQGDWTMST
jgi:hypothetical protein